MCIENTSNKPCLKYLIGFQAAAKRMQHWIKQLMAAMFSSCRVVMAQAMIVSGSELEWLINLPCEVEYLCHDLCMYHTPCTCTTQVT